MKKFSIKSIFTWNTVLVFAVFLSAFVIPILPPSWGRIPMAIGFTLIFISGFMIMENRRWIIVYLVIAAFIMQWVSGMLDLKIVEIVSRILNFLFFLIVIFSLIGEMATAKVVTARVIMASISGYLLMGIIYSGVIVFIIQRDPLAFNFPVSRVGTEDPTIYISESIYYGFVTLATLGYGDIVPLKPYSRSLATLITVTGQLYVATIIGILIGKYAASDPAHRKHEESGEN
jgi:voltage-gated potassium channel